jgi:uncharacterized protein
MNPSIPLAFLDADDASTLSGFLAAPERPTETLSYHQLQGFLYGVCCSPEMVPPADWIGAIFDDESAGYASEQEASAVLDLLMNLYNAVNASTTADHSPLPPDCGFREDLMQNFQDEAPICQWSQGFMAASEWLQDVWDQYVDEDDEELGSVMMVLGLFASLEFAESVVDEGEPTDGEGRRLTLPEFAAIAREMFDDAMLEFADLGRGMQQAQPAGPAADAIKVGRNAPCPCGSGRKYKNCCGSRTH